MCDTCKNPGYLIPCIGLHLRDKYVPFRGSEFDITVRRLKGVATTEHYLFYECRVDGKVFNAYIGQTAHIRDMEKEQRKIATEMQL